MTDELARFAPTFNERPDLNVATRAAPLTTPRDFTRALIADTAKAHGLTYADLMSRNRTRRYVVARREAIRKVYEAHPNWSYPTIGKVFGFDHTTVMFHLDRSGGRAPRMFGGREKMAAAQDFNEGKANGQF